MSRFQPWQSGTALLTALALTGGIIAPLLERQPALAQTVQTQRFSDVSSSYWANGFIQELTNRGIISGFPDGTFRPDEPVTRAQFAAMVRQAFRHSAIRQPIAFADVPSNYWAIDAIQTAYATGFMSGYPGNTFRPDENIPRVQALVSLSNGLNYAPTSSVDSTLQVYSDAAALPDWARPSVAAATQKQIVVSYPSPQYLQPDRAATRADVAAFIYQALVRSGTAAAIPSPYIVGSTGQGSVGGGGMQIPSGTTITTRYTSAKKIYISPNEPKPVPVTLSLAQPITDRNGTVLIPANSKIAGEVNVVNNKQGAQFRAQTIVLADGTQIPIDAVSPVVTHMEVIHRGANVLEMLGGAALGAGAAAAVAAVTGDRHIDTVEVLGGGAVGLLTGTLLGRDQVALFAIDPQTDLDLTLNAPLALR